MPVTKVMVNDKGQGKAPQEPPTQYTLNKGHGVTKGISASYCLVGEPRLMPRHIDTEEQEVRAIAALKKAAARSAYNNTTA